MSGLLGVRLLLLWGCACLWLSSSASGKPIFIFLHFLLSLSQVEVHSVTVDCTVTSRFAHTVMTSKAFNKANSSQEIFFEVELPKTAFITNFSMEIEGQVYVGEVKEKEKAKKQYEKAVSSGQTAGLVKASGRKMEKFSVSVNIAAESNVTFVLTYEELLQRKLGRYELLTRVKPKTLVQDFQIVTNIYEPQGISYVDAHATFLSNELLPLVEKTAHISFSPTMEQQRKCPGCDGTLIDGDFIVSYDVKREKNLGDIQIVNGYFVHFFAPELPKLPKNVVFVIDISGSMSGRKMEQTREAMLAILQQVHEDDHFAIILFDSVIETWKDSLTKATKENITEAMDYIRRMSSRGTTNINDAVLTAVNMLVKDRQMERLPDRSADMIILLTDGMPNEGESNTGKIQENMRTAIGGNMSLYCLGFGNDVDYSFLDVMSKQNKGLARRIFEASDAAAQLQGFYDEVASPLLLEVDMHYPDNAVDSLTTSHFSYLFNGTEIVVAGHLMDNDLDNFLVEVVGQGTLGVRLEVSTEDISLFQDALMIDFYSFSYSVDLLVTKDRSLTVTLRDSVKFVILLHKVWKKHPYHRDYLGFYTLDSHLLSPGVHGLLGQFYHGINYEVAHLHPGKVPEKPDATMYVKGQELNVTRGWQRDFRNDVKNGENVPCWFIHNNGTGLIDGHVRDYIVSGLFKSV
uniref:Inter-alpha-trypsin inhibitor heavy chain H3 n=1 Tax=Astatotilapia calliptera TaxID=8154 RepID=A0A3P8QDW1_ASTCA